MKIALLPNLTRKNALQVSLEVCAELEKHSMSYCIKRDYKDEFKDTKAEFITVDEMIKICDIVIAVGGDGTIIHAAKFGKPTLGINAGRIAFMAGLEPSELNMLSNLKSGKYELDRRMMLKAEIMSPDNRVLSVHYCVNDAVVARGFQIKMDDFVVEHNGKFLKHLLLGADRVHLDKLENHTVSFLFHDIFISFYSRLCSSLLLSISRNVSFFILINSPNISALEILTEHPLSIGIESSPSQERPISTSPLP